MNAASTPNLGKPWVCDQCTLINPYITPICKACRCFRNALGKKVEEVKEVEEVVTEAIYSATTLEGLELIWTNALQNSSPEMLRSLKITYLIRRIELTKGHEEMVELEKVWGDMPVDVREIINGYLFESC